MEELEAVDWYDQRIAATGNAELRAILTHNRDEEKEHASMLLEWLRRNDATFARHLRAQLFRDGEVRETKEIEAETSPSTGGEGSLGLGGLRAAGGER